MIWGTPLAGAKSNICVHLYIFFESEFGFLPENSGLNPWRFQFWGTLAWVPSPSRPHPLPPPKKNDEWISQSATPTFKTILHPWLEHLRWSARKVTTDFCPHSFHATPRVIVFVFFVLYCIVKISRSRGGTVPRCTPVSPPMVHNCRYQFTNFLPVRTYSLFDHQALISFNFEENITL